MIKIYKDNVYLNIEDNDLEYFKNFGYEEVEKSTEEKQNEEVEKSTKKSKKVE